MKNNQVKKISYTTWIKGFITFKITKEGRAYKLLPRWLLVLLLSLNSALRFIGLESNFYVFLEFLIYFIFSSFVWYFLSRLLNLKSVRPNET